MPEYDSGIVEPKSTVLPITPHLNYKMLVITLNFYYLSYCRHVTVVVTLPLLLPKLLLQICNRKIFKPGHFQSSYLL